MKLKICEQPSVVFLPISLSTKFFDMACLHADCLNRLVGSDKHKYRYRRLGEVQRVGFL